MAISRFSLQPLEVWEAQWAPYDEPTYADVLSYVQPTDVILDIGAGDLRLTKRLTARAQKVFAIEQQAGLLHACGPLPSNLGVICADARVVPWPQGITVGILLMRHCTHTGYYINRLLSAGCARLITNARWRLDVEHVNLRAAIPWQQAGAGWYACLCGATGFKPVDPHLLTPDRMEDITQVKTCPHCAADAT